MDCIVSGLMLMSVLFPAKGWFAPGQPLMVNVNAPEPITLVLADFSGQSLLAASSADVVAGKSVVDVYTPFPALKSPGTYVLYAVPRGKAMDQFIGTPLVINVREDKRRGAPPGAMVTRVQPMSYAVMETEAGPMTLAFYYDAAPNTVENFLSLAAEGYYDGLTFHRVVPGFVIQGGDPRGDGTGGPGYQIVAEFNDRPHKPGVLSMARNGDPNEAGGVIRSEYANSAGSQFFVCLDYAKTQQLNNRYTAFGKVVSGMDVVKQIAATPLADARSGRPEKPPVIKKVVVKPVLAKDNPYRILIEQARNGE